MLPPLFPVETGRALLCFQSLIQAASADKLHFLLERSFFWRVKALKVTHAGPYVNVSCRGSLFPVTMKARRHLVTLRDRMFNPLPESFYCFSWE